MKVPTEHNKAPFNTGWLNVPDLPPNEKGNRPVDPATETNDDLPPFIDEGNTPPPREDYSLQQNRELSENDIWHFLGITKSEFDELIKFKANHEARNRFAVFMLGVVFMPVTLAGALLGYIRAFNRFFRFRNTPSKKYYPDFYPLHSITRVAMALGIILAWVALLILAFVFLSLRKASSEQPFFWIVYFTINLIISGFIFFLFNIWRNGINRHISESEKFGSAKWADKHELEPFTNPPGFYIGKGLYFNDKGHILTVAGTRGGKGTNIIVPNLLGAGQIKTSWVVIDPKGENAAITANYQRSIGQNVVILNPWDLLTEYIGDAQSYNPLDLFHAIDDPNLVDDVLMLAEMIVPIKGDDKNAFFVDSARMIIAGLLLHLVTTQIGEDRSLATLWKWTRLTDNEWQDLLAEMSVNETPVNGVVVQQARREILKMNEAGDETFGSIFANVLQATAFLNSPPLKKSLQSGFDPKTLADGKTTVYVIIPADKLKSHARWLRLVVISMMRAVIRKPDKRVTFLLDEFAALGYISEIENALSTYAGFNVTVWPILQSLIQLKGLYQNNWETFIANCTVRQYFTINDNFSATYISNAIGMASKIVHKKTMFGTQGAEASQRLLITPDELRRESGKRIFMFINDLPPTYIDKVPYYQSVELNNRAKQNPYI